MVRRETRSAFTLIEVLVVIGIMLVLMSLGIGAALKAYSWVRHSNTEVVMRKVQERLARRYDQIVLEARGWETPVGLLRLASGNPRRAEALKIKLIYKWSHPMNYAEVEASLLESAAYGYAPQGYPFLVALRSRLASKMGGTGVSLTNRATLQAQLGITPAEDLRNQNAACLLAIFETTLGSSVDELAPSEIGKYPDNPAPSFTAAFDNNPLIVDSWGTPLFFMRYGNLVTGFAADGDSPLVPFAWLPLVLGPTSPVETTGIFVAGAPGWTFTFGAINGRYYSQIVDRAKLANPLKFQRRSDPIERTRVGVDLDDPEGLLTLGWRNDTRTWWVYLPLPGAFLTLPCAFDTAAVPSGFTRTFGYRMTSSNTELRLYAPQVILSAGPDGVFSTWDDNLDSYRMTVRVGQQQ